VESSQQRGHSRMWCEKSVNIGKKPHNVDFVLFLIRGKKYRISWIGLALRMDDGGALAKQRIELQCISTH
jgi:hypothetical protein